MLSTEGSNSQKVRNIIFNMMCIDMDVMILYGCDRDEICTPLKTVVTMEMWVGVVSWWVAGLGGLGDDPDEDHHGNEGGEYQQ